MKNVKKLEFARLDEVDEKTLTVAKLIVEKKLVDLEYRQNETMAKFPYKICEKGIKGSNYFAENLLDYATTKDKYFGRIINNEIPIDLTRKCKNSKCSFQSCPLMVATHFRNLCDNVPSLEENIENINFVKSDDELKKIINDLIGLKETKKQLIKLVDFYAKKRNLKKAKTLNFQFYNNFILMGNDELQQNKIVNIIKMILLSNQIISDKDYKEFYALEMDFDKSPARPNLSDYESLIIKELSNYKLIYLKDFGKILDLKQRKEDFYYKFINTLKKIILDKENEKIFILSGKKEQLKRILDENGELASLFGYRLELEDYDEDILTNEILKKLEDTQLPCEISDIELKSRISHLYRKSNFTNSNFIQETVQKTLKNFFESESNSITIDMLPSTKEEITIDEIMKEINELIGLRKIKQELKNLSKFLKYNKKLEEINGVSKTLNLHMIFSGNAGTGKTTVARLLADILYNMGYIEERKITEITSKDLIGEYMGQTAPKARKTIEKALGGVLFIDEAYSLANKSSNGKGYGAEAIVELLKCMEDYQDKIVIIFAGYHDEMNDFVNLNPGLKSRIRYNFEFEDYNEDELIAILNLKLKALNLTISEEALKALKRIISFNMKATNFGNGRYVDNLVNNLLIKHSLNITDEDNENLFKITIKDVNSLSETNEININDVFKDLDKLIGLKNIKAELKQLVDYLQYNKKLEKYNIYPKDLNLHMVFSGNPGTGKTTVARLLSNIFYTLGFLPENKLTEITAKDLLGEYVGQTAPKVKRQIENALGGVLFIDEAYALNQNSMNGYGGEAIAELLVSMEKYYDRLIIVFSGYEKEMKSFIDSNPGLKSRIGKIFDFNNYSKEELIEILKMFVTNNNLKITEESIRKFELLTDKIMKEKNFGNARWVRNAFDKILLAHSTNTKESNDELELITITVKDIESIETKNTQSSMVKFGFDIGSNLKEKVNNINIFESEEVDSLW